MMESLTTVTKLMKKNCFMASVDIRQANYSVPIHPDFQKYVCVFEIPNREVSCAPTFGSKMD